MKKTVKIIATVVLMISALSAFSQKGKYGGTPEDSVKCIENLSVYMSPYFSGGDYKEAVKYWRVCFNTCPKASKNMYINGAKMYKQFIKEAEDDSTKRAYLDTLMMIYDQRIANFGDEGKVLEKKGTDYLKNSKKDPEVAYEWLKKAVELQGNNLGPGGAVYYYQSMYKMLQQKKMEKSVLIDAYVPIMDIVDFNINKYKSEGKDKYVGYWGKSKVNIDKYFSAIAKPEDIVNSFQPKFDANPKDTILLKTIVNLLEKKEKDGGTEVELYKNAAANLCQVSPSYTCLMALGGLNSKNKNYVDAYGFFKEATEMAKTDEEKIKSNFKAAQVAYNLKQYSSTRAHCKAILVVNPNYGEAYLLIGDCYSSTKFGENELEKKYVYWAAMDKYSKAKAVDPSVAEKADKKHANAKGHGPSKELLFQYGVIDKPSVTVGGWINETTTVRVPQ
ncbi:MAG: tetratricopeptide repeat protein [Flavobacteriales bacterium]|nr:tetratricopeptide repeat protein [Flavobacteriales bacterium]